MKREMQGGPDRFASVRLAGKIVSTLGWGWALYRLWYAAERKTGLFRLRMPAHSWSARPLPYWLEVRVPSDDKGYFAWKKSQPPRFLFQRVEKILPPGIAGSSKAIEECDLALAGTWRYFGHRLADVGFPPDWHANPINGQRAPADRHWSQIGDFDFGDVRTIWEPNRFALTYSLVRAYAATCDERYPNAFWTLVEDWAGVNPPQSGPNWKCGQEAAFRVIAWCFGLHAFLETPSTTPERMTLLATMVAVHADRIEGNMAYARSQKNNHAISEGMGLWTVGLLFPEFKRARRWRELGRKALEEEIRRQVYDDGSYIQHSANYHRVMLQDYIWALRLGELQGYRFSDQLYGRLSKAVGFLYGLTDERTGQVPDYGGNDGTLVLPLNDCDHNDFRPVLQAAHYLLNKKHLYPHGPWDEDLAWLFGSGSVERPTHSGSSPSQAMAAGLPAPGNYTIVVSNGLIKRGEPGGFHVLRGQDSRAIVRCARYKNRPSHADQLHVELWWKGINIACDAGTYLYGGEPPWDNGLARTGVHNTITLDRQDQMTRAGRFLWLDWAQGHVLRQARSRRGLLEYWEGEHDGYARMRVTHHRAVLRAASETWLVIDDVFGIGDHVVRLHWLLADLPFELRRDINQLILKTPAGLFGVTVCCSRPARLTLVRGGLDLSQDSALVDGEKKLKGIAGWCSRYYTEKKAALSLSLEAQATLPVRFISSLSAPPLSTNDCHDKSLSLNVGDSITRVTLSSPGVSPIVRECEITQNDCVETLPLISKPRSHTLLIHQAFVSPDEAGGTRHFELASALANHGHRFTIVGSNVSYLSGNEVGLGEGSPSEGQHDGVRILRAYTHPSLHRSLLWRVFATMTFAISSIPAALRAGPADVVMGTTPPMFQALSAWLVARLRRCPFLLEVRDLWPEFAIGMGVLRNRFLIAVARWLEGFLYARAAHIVVNSPAYRDYLLAKGISAGKISLIANGVDAEMFDPAADGKALRDELGLQDRFVVTYAGALGMANDLETVLRAAQRLRDEPRVHFLLVGDGKERPSLENRARQLGLTNVTFVGGQPKKGMPSFLAASQACVAVLKDIPMFRTTYPNKVFDYMAAGRPTILLIDGVIRDVMDAAGGGIFVSPGDDAALGEAIRSLLRDQKQAALMGAAARAYVVEHFDRRKQAEQLSALVSRLSGRVATS